MANEKSKLALQLGESKCQLTVLKTEIEKLKMYQEQSNMEMKQLNDENTVLRNRLRDVAHSPLSDSEKQQLLLDSRQHSSAPASIATNLLDDVSAGELTACPTPEWDKHSSSNVSEVSVACLQDKINQMQETHYSTNEELQATLQELTDLQRQLTELQHDNERLLEEKNLMFDSLCRQTERLNDTRNEVESLKQLLYREKDDTGQFETVVEREQKLVELLKSTQEEREGLLLKQEQLNAELQEVRSINSEQAIELEQLTERVRTLECTLDAKHAEHKQLDQELAVARDQSSGRQIEIDRLTDLLETARTKIGELEQDRTLSDKSELDELLDNARKEKDVLESEVTHLKEQLARSRNEAEKLKEQVSILQDECKVTRNNAKCTQSELEYKCDRLLMEKNTLAEQLQQLQEAANELQVQAQCQQEDKRQLSSVLSETQRNLSEAERKNLELENEVSEIKRLRKEENEEWEKFQNDLLTSVRVANDFKTEAQESLQKMIMENKAHRERVRQLEAQIDKLKGSNSKDILPPSDSEHPRTNPLFNFYRGKKYKLQQNDDKKDNNNDNIEVYKFNNVKGKSKGGKELSSSASGNLVRRTPSNVKEELYLLSKEIDTKSRLSEKDIAIMKLIAASDFKSNQSGRPKVFKPKHDLAISKPLLTSVLENPKLRSYIENTEIQTIMNEFDENQSQNQIQNLDGEDEQEIIEEDNYEDLYRYKDASSLFHASLSNINYQFYEEKERNLSFETFRKSKSVDDISYRKYSTFDDLTYIDTLSNAKNKQQQQQQELHHHQEEHFKGDKLDVNRKSDSFLTIRNQNKIKNTSLNFDSNLNINRNTVNVVLYSPNSSSKNKTSTNEDDEENALLRWRNRTSLNSNKNQSEQEEAIKSKSVKQAKNTNSNDGKDAENVEVEEEEEIPNEYEYEIITKRVSNKDKNQQPENDFLLLNLHKNVKEICEQFLNEEINNSALVQYKNIVDDETILKEQLFVDLGLPPIPKLRNKNLLYKKRPSSSLININELILNELKEVCVKFLDEERNHSSQTLPPDFVEYFIANKSVIVDFINEEKKLAGSYPDTKYRKEEFDLKPLPKKRTKINTDIVKTTLKPQKTEVMPKNLGKEDRIDEKIKKIHVDSKKFEETNLQDSHKTMVDVLMVGNLKSKNQNKVVKKVNKEKENKQQAKHIDDDDVDIQEENSLTSKLKLSSKTSPLLASKVRNVKVRKKFPKKCGFSELIDEIVNPKNDEKANQTGGIKEASKGLDVNVKNDDEIDESLHQAQTTPLVIQTQNLNSINVGGTKEGLDVKNDDKIDETLHQGQTTPLVNKLDENQSGIIDTKFIVEKGKDEFESNFDETRSKLEDKTFIEDDDRKIKNDEFESKFDELESKDQTIISNKLDVDNNVIQNPKLIEDKRWKLPVYHKCIHGELMLRNPPSIEVEIDVGEDNKIIQNQKNQLIEDKSRNIKKDQVESKFDELRSKDQTIISNKLDVDNNVIQHPKIKDKSRKFRVFHKCIHDELSLKYPPVSINVGEDNKIIQNQKNQLIEDKSRNIKKYEVESNLHELRPKDQIIISNKLDGDLNLSKGGSRNIKKDEFESKLVESNLVEYQTIIGLPGNSTETEPIPSISGHQKDTSIINQGFDVSFECEEHQVEIRKKWTMLNQCKEGYRNKLYKDLKQSQATSHGKEDELRRKESHPHLDFSEEDSTKFYIKKDQSTLENNDIDISKDVSYPTSDTNQSNLNLEEEEGEKYLPRHLLEYPEGEEEEKDLHEHSSEHPEEDNENIEIKIDDDYLLIKTQRFLDNEREFCSTLITEEFQQAYLPFLKELKRVLRRRQTISINYNEAIDDEIKIDLNVDPTSDEVKNVERQKSTTNSSPYDEIIRFSFDDGQHFPHFNSSSSPKPWCPRESLELNLNQCWEEGKEEDVDDLDVSMVNSDDFLYKNGHFGEVMSVKVYHNADQEDLSAEEYEITMDKKTDKTVPIPAELSSTDLGGKIRREDAAINIFASTTQQPASANDPAKDKSQDKGAGKEVKKTFNELQTSEENEPNNQSREEIRLNMNTNSKNLYANCFDTGSSTPTIEVSLKQQQQETSKDKFADEIALLRHQESCSKVSELRKKFEGEPVTVKQTHMDLRVHKPNFSSSAHRKSHPPPNTASSQINITAVQVYSNSDNNVSERESFTNAKRMFQQLSGEQTLDIITFDDSSTSEECSSKMDDNSYLSEASTIPITESHNDKNELSF